MLVPTLFVGGNLRPCAGVYSNLEILRSTQNDRTRFSLIPNLSLRVRRSNLPNFEISHTRLHRGSESQYLTPACICRSEELRLNVKSVLQ